MNLHPTAARHPRGTRRSAHAERGSAIFLLLILAVVTATVLAGVFSYISIASKAERRSNVRLEGTYAAEYAFEQAYQQLGNLIGQNAINLPNAVNTSGVTNLTTAPTSVFTAANGYTWQAFITVPIDGDTGVPTDAFTTGSGSSQGTYEYVTVVEFTRTVAGIPKPVHMQFQREWDYSISPLFQYAIFYNSDLELFPGATFNISGRVHSNGKIYTGTTASIAFSDYVTDVNGVSNHYSPLDPRTEGALNGTITYAKGTPIVTSQKNPPGQLGADTTDTNVNNDGSHELIEVPNAWQTDVNASERMYNKAGLKVLVNSSSSDVTSDSNVAVAAGKRVYLTSDGTIIPAGDALSDVIGTFVGNTTIGNSTVSVPDYREGAVVHANAVDVNALKTAYDQGGLPQTIPSTSKWPNNSSVPAALRNKSIDPSIRGKALWNGVLYVADLTNSTSHRTGVQIVNGASLPNGTNSSSPTAGLTIATPNAAYIAGDYNTGGSPDVDNSSKALTASNVVTGYTAQPAAVIADAVTVLSNSWSSSYTLSTSLSSRTPSNTTINSALISGIVASDGTNYSGGAENYIRLLENWSSKRLTYYGSMVNVYASQQSTHPWQNTGNYYNAPTRNWYFDTNFLDPNKLPPGTPMLRTLSRGAWAQIQ